MRRNLVKFRRIFGVMTLGTAIGFCCRASAGTRSAEPAKNQPDHSTSELSPLPGGGRPTSIVRSGFVCRCRLRLRILSAVPVALNATRDLINADQCRLPWVPLFPLIWVPVIPSATADRGEEATLAKTERWSRRWP